jgi:hypothetical protein
MDNSPIGPETLALAVHALPKAHSLSATIASFQALEISHDRLRVIGLQLVRRHGRIGGVATGSHAGLQELLDSRFAPACEQPARRSQIGRCLVPAFHFVHWLKVERCAFQPFGRVQLTGFGLGRVALLAPACLFHKVLSASYGIRILCEADKRRGAQQSKKFDHGLC